MAMSVRVGMNRVSSIMGALIIQFVTTGPRWLEGLPGVEASHRQKNLERHLSVYRLDKSIPRKSGPEPVMNLPDLDFVHQINLVQHDHVREGHLSKLELHVLRNGQYLLSVHQAHDAIQSYPVTKLLVRESHSNTAGVRDSARLQKDVFRGLRPPQHHLNCLYKIVANGTTHAAICEAHNIIFDTDHEVCIYIYRTKIVDQHCNSKAMIAIENAIQ